MKKIIAVCLISILATSCASQGIKPEARDKSGKFTGVWDAFAHVSKQTAIIDVSGGKAKLACRERKFGFTLYIAEGNIVSTMKKKSGDGYINEDGTFYVEGPFDKDRGENFFFSGRLGVYEGEGDVVISYENPNQGCKGKISLKRVVGATTTEELFNRN